MGNVQKASKKDEEQGLSKLHLAAERGDTEAVRSILMSSAKFNAWWSHLLQYSTEKGEVDAINRLLSERTNVNSRNAFGQTSLHLASKNGHLPTAQLLLSNNADVNAVCRMRATPLHLGANSGHSEIVQNLIFNGANVNACNNDKMTPLHLACRNGHTSIVTNLLDNKATVYVKEQSEETPFYLAAKNGHADISDMLLLRGVCDFVLKKGVETPLHVAVEGGHTKVVKVILKHSCRISEKLAKEREYAKKCVPIKYLQPFELLKSDGRGVSVSVILAETTTPLEIMEDSDGDTALELAIRSTQPKMVQLLINADQCAYSEKHLRNGFNCLIKRILYCKETVRVRSYMYDEEYETNCENIKEIAKTLINSSKFNVNHQDWEGETALHKVLSCLHIQWPQRIQIYINYLMQLLLEKGADFNMKSSSGETPLIIASKKGYCDAIEILFDWEKKSGMKLDVDKRDQFGATALIRAAERNDASVMRLLLNHKASVNLYDYYGFTALHAAIWSDLHFFGKWLLKQNLDYYYLEILRRDKSTWRKETVNPSRVFGRLLKFNENHEKYTRDTEQAVKLLLDNVETNVNAINLRGNTPLDLAVKLSNRINSATLKALKNRGAIHNSLQPEDEAPIEVTGFDERGRNPLHLLIIFRFLYDANGDKTEAEREQGREIFDLLFSGILLIPEIFRELATATDDKRRTPLYYAFMTPSYSRYQDHDLVSVLLEQGSNVNAADMYGKTPLHYAEENDQYDLLVQYGANENTKDNFGDTPRDLKQMRKSVTINEDNAKKLTIGKKALYVCKDIAHIFNINHVTELSKRKLVDMIRIDSQTTRPQESSEEAIWKIWTENDLIRLNRRLRKLRPLIQHFIERLADGIKEKDWRFECQPMLVGSANEETKVVISADFDFSFKLINFSQRCDPFPHPLGPKGYFQLRRKPIEDIESRSGDKFDCFFSLDQCLLTNEVNSRFQLLVGEVLNDPYFWQDEHLFECCLPDREIIESEKPAGLCKTVRIRMIHPIKDGEGDFLFVKISIDIVACVHVKDWWPEDPLPVGINPAVKAKGSTFVFDRPRFNRSKPLFSETVARISFAPAECRFIKESSPLIMAAYTVCKMILYSHKGASYQLKNCLFYCMEALVGRNGGETGNEDESFTPKQLAFWAERLMFCFKEFSRYDFYPCYFMPTFRQRVKELRHDKQYLERRKEGNVDVSSETLIPFSYPIAYDYYLDLCPDHTAIDIPIIIQREDRFTNSLDANFDPTWEQFDREEFIRRLSSRSLHY